MQDRKFSIVDYDETGNLVDGIFYELEIPLVIQGCLGYSEKEVIKGILLGNVNTTDCVFTGIDISFDEIYGCAENHTHLTGYLPTKAELRLQYTHGVVYSFLPAGGDAEWDLIIASERFVKELRCTDFSGYEAIEAHVIDAQPRKFHNKYFWLKHIGAECWRGRRVNIPEPNECPFCGYRPIVCPTCKTIEYSCPGCSQAISVLINEHLGENDRRFIIEYPPQKGMVLDGRKWDGSDFIPGWHLSGFLSKRVVEWLITIDAKPFIAHPARMDVTGMSTEQIRWVDRATGK